jgi:hypothetical protein
MMTLINLKKVIILVIIFILLLNIIIPNSTAYSENNGFDKGVSWKPVVPIEKVTFVDFDEESYLDDYSYLASIPTSVFYYDDKLYSHPLLYYQGPLNSDKKEITLDARTGINYFMEDWMEYCYQRLDEMILINVPKYKVNHWSARNYTVINGNNSYDIANKIALHDWSYSDNVVLAVIEEDFKKPDNIINNKVEGQIQSNKLYHERTLDLKQTNRLNPVHENFNVAKKYRYLKAEVWWDSLIFGPGMMIPAGDPDIQLYVEQKTGWMQTSAASQWNVIWPLGKEYAYSHVYNSGNWRIGVTDIPTKTNPTEKKLLGGLITLQGSLLKALGKKVTYHADITMYPGVDVTLEDNPPFGCKSADIKLTWDDPAVNLGFTLVGPGGEAIFTTINESRTDYLEEHYDQLGECLAGENYSISVFTTKDLDHSVNFEIEYTWSQNISKAESNSLTSATQGAVLASVLNAPLMYVSPSVISKDTKDILYKLGVENIYLVDIGNRLSSNVKDEIEEITKIKEVFIEEQKIYEKIRGITNSNDVVFSTIDPWTYWLFDKSEPAGEKEGALFIGPAAYIAAHHGVPVFIIENHPELSSAVVWHNEFWRRYSGNRSRYHVNVADMVLTGRRIYDFLRKNNLDKEGLETIITVADQYDIGIPWDRIFPGIANSGRICGTPVDTSYWIARIVHYPALIYVNPAMQGEVQLTNGSVSKREVGIYKGTFLGIFKNNNPLISIKLGTFKITKQSKLEEYKYPVLCSFVAYEHRFNERASEYYGGKYQCADGIIPGESPTMEAIDDGSIKKYTGNLGSYFPDMTISEVIPFYLEKGKYGVAFSTKLENVVEDLNSGVILWIHNSHGGSGNGGSTLFWNPTEGLKKSGYLSAKLGSLKANVLKEKNPWRGYEWVLGSTEEPDTMTMDIKGFLPFTNLRIPGLPPTGQAWVIARKPIREFLNSVIPIFNPFNVDNLYDGVVGALTHSTFAFTGYNSIKIEENLENLHSAGFITGICETSNTYLHTMLIRHGSVFQIKDPWPTSWYSSVWLNSIPRDMILGYTAGEAYTRGIAHVGILYLGGAGVNGDEPQWWWDDAENVIFFGDPDTRIFVPSTEYSDLNNWEKPVAITYEYNLAVEGHNPFGAKSNPHAKSPTSFLDKYILYIALIVIIIIVVMIMGVSGIRKKKKRGRKV